jgi:acetylornithine/N-succinyldiaminopimelate aminotransferase
MTAALPTHIEAASPHVMNTYGRLPIALDHGQGCRVWDVNGKAYLDALGGIAVNTLGHNHPKLVPALQEQIAKLIHTSNYYHVPLQETLAARLVELSGLENVFFCSTGLEANEAALKLARKFGHDKGIERPEIVVYEKAFHGRSIATLSATGNPKVQAGFGPLVEGFIRVPLNNIDALKAATANNPNVVAVFFEAIQGEGGINSMKDEYLREVRALCDERDWLLMIDEVQCGMGRTGKWFAHQWAGIKPDVMPLAKGLGSGDHLRAALARELAGEKGLKEIRGRGLMLGIELTVPCGELLGRAAENGLLLSVTADTVIRMVPSLIMTTAEADEAVAILVPLIKQLLKEKNA